MAIVMHSAGERYKLSPLSLPRLNPQPKPKKNLIHLKELFRMIILYQGVLCLPNSSELVGKVCGRMQKGHYQSITTHVHIYLRIYFTAF